MVQAVCLPFVKRYRPEGARLGALSIMVGGDAQTFSEATTTAVFEAIGGYHAHMGGAGAGAAAKLVNQLLTAVNALAAAEGLALARSLGCDANIIAKRRAQCEVVRSIF